MNNIKYGCKLASILVLLTLIINWNNVFLPLKIIYYLQSYNGFAMLLVVMGLLFVLVNGVAAVGLYRMQWWGFVTAYVAIVFSTVIFSANYIPFVDKLMPVQYSFYGLMIANVSVLSLVIYLQVKSRVEMPARKNARRKTKNTRHPAG